jgi:hypothetical protein
MAIFGQADLTANSNNLVVALGAAATVNILLCNRTSNIITVSVAIVPSGTSVPANQHWIEFALSLDPDQPLERGGIPLNTGDQVFVNPSASGVSCSVIGINI